jgi:UDP-glucose 4-epimerase
MDGLCAEGAALSLGQRHSGSASYAPRWIGKGGGRLRIGLPGVWSEETYGKIEKNRKERPSYEWSPYWEYGAFIDVRDLADAVYKAITVNWDGYRCELISSDDITTSGKTSREFVDFLFPGMPWKGDNSFFTDPFKTLLDNSGIKKLLAWSPRYSWRKHKEVQ